MPGLRPVLVLVSLPDVLILVFQRRSLGFSEHLAPEARLVDFDSPARWPFAGFQRFSDG